MVLPKTRRGGLLHARLGKGDERGCSPFFRLIVSEDAGPALASTEAYRDYVEWRALELLDECKRRGITVTARSKKQDLIDLLRRLDFAEDREVRLEIPSWRTLP